MNFVSNISNLKEFFKYIFSEANKRILSDLKQLWQSWLLATISDPHILLFLIFYVTSFYQNMGRFYHNMGRVDNCWYNVDMIWNCHYWYMSGNKYCIIFQFNTMLKVFKWMHFTFWVFWVYWGHNLWRFLKPAFPPAYALPAETAVLYMVNILRN